MDKLLLFDIDGTLMWGGGAAKRAFEHALTGVFGTAGPIGTLDFSGKTDPQIARELLRRSGRTDEEIDELLPSLWASYLEGLGPELIATPPTVLPGVRRLLDRLEAASGVALGLVTGNIVGGAALKLRSVGLAGRFAIGGYGSDHELRRHLPGIAIERAVGTWGVDFDGQSVWVIGDTPRDVACGKYHGTRTLAVATGYFDRYQLAATGADFVFDDFADVDAVVEVILG